MGRPGDGIWTAARIATVLSIKRLSMLFLDWPVKVLFEGWEARE